VRKTNVKKIFGAAVRSRRRQLGISQEELAERADLHRTYISDVERGSRNVSLENIERLASALDLSIAALFPQAEAEDI
jgi:transcriptional regulator with XRE-family HTH domain